MKNTKSIRPSFFAIASLVLLALIAVYSVYQDYQRRAIREKLDQERAIERQATVEIQELGGMVNFGSPPDLPVISVTFMFTGELTNGKQVFDGGPMVRQAVTNDTKITDDGLKHLKKLSKLQSLYLDTNKVTDEGLKHLEGLTNLQTLHLDANKVTDEGLVHLEGLTNLQSLSLINTKVTDEGVEKLQKAIPNCRIAH